MLFSLANSVSLSRLADDFSVMLRDQLHERATNIDDDLKSTIDSFTLSAIQAGSELTDYFQEQDVYPGADGSMEMNYSTLKEINNMFVSSIGDTVVANDISGAYLIWNAQFKQQKSMSDGIYVIDRYPQNTLPGNSDLSLKTGSALLASEFSIEIDSDWSRYFDFSKGESVRPAFDLTIARSILAKLHNPENGDTAGTRIRTADSGYWSEPFIPENKTMVYTIPLTANGSALYGIFGIEIDLQSIAAKLPERDPGYQNSSYMLAILENDTVLINPALAKESTRNIMRPYFPIESDMTSIKLSESDQEGLFYGNVINGDTVTEISSHYLAVQPLDMITAVSPEDTRQWVVVEIVEAAEFSGPIDDIKNKLFIIILSSVLLAVVGAFAAGTKLAKPLVVLSRYLRKHKNIEDIQLPRFNITEVDLLSESIEKLSYRLRDSSFKTASIIDLLDLPIASFEEQPEMDTVIVSSAMREILDLDMEYQLQSRLDMTTWNSIVEYLLSKPEPDYEDVYRWQPGGKGNIKWLKLRQARHDGRVSGIIIDISEEILKHRRLVKERDYDELTKLYTRQAFIQKARKMTANAKSGQYAVLLFADLDNLKHINDTYGHQFGDQYLQLAASFFSRFRKENGLAGRFAGDEFAAFLGMVADKEKAVSICEEIMDLMPDQEIKLPDNQVMELSASVGAAIYPDDSKDIEELLEYADFAMYQRKNAGKKGLTWFNHEQFVRSREALARRADLDEIISEELIEYVAQPIISTVDGDVTGFDLRLRPLHNRINLPLDLIRIAAEEGRLAQLEALMMKKASEWVEQNSYRFPQIKVFLHLFETYSCQFTNINQAQEIVIDEREQGNWREKTGAGFDDVYYENLRGRIVFVVDVSGAVPAEVFSCCHQRCHKYQAEIAMIGLSKLDANRVLFDDWLPAFIIMDMSMVRDIPADKSRQELLAIMFDYCRRIGIKSIAAGVSSVEEFSSVLKLGADHVEGYYTGMPAKTAEPANPEAVLLIKKFHQS